MPCPRCRLNPVLVDVDGSTMALVAPLSPAADDLPVCFHPVAIKSRVPTVPAFMRSINAPPEHTGPEWQLRWGEPKICGGCGTWFSERLPPLEGGKVP